MPDSEKEEAANLKMEFQWVLQEEVHAILHQLHSVLVECAHKFPVPLYGNDGQKQDKFILTSVPEQLKCVVTLTGDSITHASKYSEIGVSSMKIALPTINFHFENHLIRFVNYGDWELHFNTRQYKDIWGFFVMVRPVWILKNDISFKVVRQMNSLCRTSIQQDNPWKLQQIQDAANHLQQAIGHIDNVDKHYVFRSSDEVLHIIGCLLGALERARTALVLPKKRTIEELMNGRNMKSLLPNLPDDLAVSFYIQSHKLIFAAYQLSPVHGSMRFDSCQTECAVPWLSDVLWILTAALHMCQQLKDKLCVFSQYKDFTLNLQSSTTISC